MRAVLLIANRTVSLSAEMSVIQPVVRSAAANVAQMIVLLNVQVTVTPGVEMIAHLPAAQVVQVNAVSAANNQDMA